MSLYLRTVGSDTPAARAMSATETPLLHILLMSSILSTPIILSWPPRVENGRIDKGRPHQRVVGVPMHTCERFSCPDPKEMRAHSGPVPEIRTKR